MPDRNDIEKLNSLLTSLGGEEKPELSTHPEQVSSESDHLDNDEGAPESMLPGQFSESIEGYNDGGFDAEYPFGEEGDITFGGGADSAEGYGSSFSEIDPPSDGSSPNLAPEAETSFGEEFLAALDSVDSSATGDATPLDFELPELNEEDSIDRTSQEEASEKAVPSSGEMDSALPLEIPESLEIEDFDLSSLDVPNVLGGSFSEDDEIGTASTLPIDFQKATTSQEDSSEVSLTEREFEQLQIGMDRLPLSLRTVIQERIGAGGFSSEELNDILSAIIQGDDPKKIASRVTDITGIKIAISSRYRAHSGVDFDDKISSPWYLFQKKVAPVLGTLLLALAVVGGLSYIIYGYVYSPLHAGSIYRSGLEEIERENYVGGNELFNRATGVWHSSRWYYRYADAFADAKQYGLAEEKYQQLVEVPGYSDNEEALIRYSRFESEVMGKYSQANQLLRRIFSKSPYHREALLLAGDNFLSWGDEQEASHYEDARYHYAMLMEQYGQRPEYLLRMMRYLIRVDNYPGVVALKGAFDDNPDWSVTGVAYAELAEYLIDRDELEGVMEVLTRAQEAEVIPEVLYQFSRFYRKTNNSQRERLSLDATLEVLQLEGVNSVKRLVIKILSHNRVGELLYEQGHFLDAEEEYSVAIQLYEESLNLRRLERSAEFGKIYVNLGDIYYHVASDYPTAMRLFTDGEENGYMAPAVRYKKGYIHYLAGEYRSALNEFYLAADGYSSQTPLLFATAMTLNRRNDFFAAQGYYNELISALEEERRRILFLLVNEEESHRRLVENMMITYNNQAVNQYNLYLASGDRNKYSDALVSLTRSQELYDYLTREEITRRRSETVSLAQLNMRTLLYPTAEFELQHFPDLPKTIGLDSFK